MKKGLVITLCVVGVLAVLILTPVVAYIHAYDYGAQQDSRLAAQYDNMQNILSSASLKIQEAAQVPQMYSKDLANVAKAAIQGRYGANGSKATFQWIQEHNPTVDPKLFVNIQEIIEGGQDNFQNSQTQFLDMKREYQAQLNSFWSGTWLRIAGYPKKSLDSYKLISSDYAQNAFKTGVQQVIKLPQ